MHRDEQDKLVAVCTRISVFGEKFPRDKFLHSDLGVRIFPDSLVTEHVFLK